MTVDVVFDLDGTLSDPAVGITRSINYALAAYGHDERPLDELTQFIGPPLDATFRQLSGGRAEVDIVGMVAKYRERYGSVGYAENVLYAGIPDALQRLSGTGLRLGVCTSKRVDFAESILAMFGLREHFVFVNGGDVGVQKGDQLRALLAEGHLAATATMVGDRAVDVVAARANGLRSIGVLWGHGSREELEEAGADELLEHPEQIGRLAPS